MLTCWNIIALTVGNYTLRPLDVSRTLVMTVKIKRVVTCRVVAMQRPRNGRIYQRSFWATAQLTSSHRKESTRNSRGTFRTRFSTRSVPEDNWGDQVSSVREAVKKRVSCSSA
jgi:hypothetical protein